MFNLGKRVSSEKHVKALYKMADNLVMSGKYVYETNIIQKTEVVSLIEKVTREVICQFLHKDLRVFYVERACKK